MTTTLPLRILKRILLVGWLLFASAFAACFVHPAPYAWRGWRYRLPFNQLVYRMNVWTLERLSRVTLKFDGSAALQKREGDEEIGRRDDTYQQSERAINTGKLDYNHNLRWSIGAVERLDYNLLHAIGGALAAVLSTYLAAKNGGPAGLALLVIAALFAVMSVLFYLARRRDPDK